MKRRFVSIANLRRGVRVVELERFEVELSDNLIGEEFVYAGLTWVIFESLYYSQRPRLFFNLNAL